MDIDYKWARKHAKEICERPDAWSQATANLAAAHKELLIRLDEIERLVKSGI